MTLLGNRILLDPIEEAEGPIVAPQLSKKKTPLGRIVMLGNAMKVPDLQVGQKVYVDTNYGSIDVPHDGRIHRIVSAADVQLILDAA